MAFELQVLEDAGISLIDGDRGKNYPKQLDFMDSGHCLFLSAKNVTNTGFQFEDTTFISEDRDNILRAGKLIRNDIALTTRGTIGNVAFYGDSISYEHIRINSGMIIIRCDENLWNPRFLYFLFTSQVIRQQIEALTSGSAVPQLPARDLKKFKLPNIPKAIQDNIVEQVGALTDKVALNQQINQTLEHMAQALFKSWFLDFDPVIDNALAAGNEIPEALQHKAEQRKQAQQLQDFKPLPDNIRALFPSEFEQTDEPEVGIAGWIPKGWKPTRIHHMVDTISDTYKLKEVDEVIFLNTGDIEDGKFLHKDYSSTDGLPGQAKKSIAKGDILYSEIRPKNKRYAFVDFDAEEYVVSTKLMVLRAKTNINPLLPYFILTQDKTVNELQHVAEHRSGTFPQITFKELAKVLAVFPQGPELIDLFVEQYLTPLFTKKLASIEQNEQLEKLRDTLLPKLISGELSVENNC